MQERSVSWPELSVGSETKKIQERRRPWFWFPEQRLLQRNLAMAVAVAMAGAAILPRPWRLRISSLVDRRPQRLLGVARAQASSVEWGTSQPSTSPFCPQVRLPWLHRRSRAPVRRNFFSFARLCVFLIVVLLSRRVVLLSQWRQSTRIG